MPDGVSFGEPSFLRPDDSETFSPVRIRRFSQAVLSAEAWFYTADELIAAMDLVEPNVERFWEDIRSIAAALDQTSEMPPKHQNSDAAPKDEKSDVPSKHSLINQHMMLAGFAIENLCKGYLADRLSPQEGEKVQAGALPNSLTGHNLLKLVEQTGMTVSDTEKYLLNRITDAVVWRGRYPSPTSHEKTGPFAQIGSDISRIKTLLQKLRRHVGAKDS
jgi:hypothetical protein